MTEALMEYLPPQSALKYTGQVAAGYDSKREQSPKWIIEQRIIENMLSEMPEGSIILDVPCGTGRFFDCYQRNKLLVYGMDISPDMLNQAAQKIKDPNRFKLIVNDARMTGLPDKHVDCAVVCRLTRWLSPADNQVMIREMQRVAKKRIIWTARVANHIHARSIELFESALDGWRITRNEAGYVLDYRILEATPC